MSAKYSDSNFWIDYCHCKHSPAIYNNIQSFWQGLSSVTRQAPNRPELRDLTWTNQKAALLLLRFVFNKTGSLRRRLPDMHWVERTLKSSCVIVVQSTLVMVSSTPLVLSFAKVDRSGTAQTQLRTSIVISKWNNTYVVVIRCTLAVITENKLLCRLHSILVRT